MNHRQRTQTLTTKNKTPQAPSTPRRVDELLSEYLENQLEPRRQKFGKIDESFRNLLPATLASHCRPDSVTAGNLKVIVDSPVYMHELRLCGEEIVRELKSLCPRARITKITPTIG